MQSIFCSLRKEIKPVFSIFSYFCPLSCHLTVSTCCVQPERNVLPLAAFPEVIPPFPFMLYRFYIHLGHFFLKSLFVPDMTRCKSNLKGEFFIHLSLLMTRWLCYRCVQATLCNIGHFSCALRAWRHYRLTFEGEKSIRKGLNRLC